MRRLLKYATADEWRAEAMQRVSSISESEIIQRRTQASRHYQQEEVMPNADTLADHELFILGKMDLSEYEQYLLLKHSPKT